MALSFLGNSDDSISLKEFIKILDDKINHNDENSLLECSDAILALSNNKEFFINFLNTNLKGDVNKFQMFNQYSEQSYILHETLDYFVRVTYWPVLSKNKIIKNTQNKLFSYGLAHDHNFSLLTAGYKGNGYRTKLWEYDYNSVVGFVGEKVDFQYLEETTLSERKALYYRPSQDIHSQYPPLEEDSLAINIILNNKGVLNKQYEFDVENGQIKSILYGSPATAFKYSIINLSKFIHNDTTIDLLTQLANNHAENLVRQECLDSLYHITNSDDIYEKALENSSQNIVKYAKHCLKT